MRPQGFGAVPPATKQRTSWGWPCGACDLGSIWGLLTGQGGGIGVQLWDGGPRWHVLELHFTTDRLSWPSLQSGALGPESRALRTLGFCVTPLVHLFVHLPYSWAFSCQKFSGPG